MVQTQVGLRKVNVTTANIERLRIRLAKLHDHVANRSDKAIPFTVPMKHLPRIQRRSEVEVGHVENVPLHAALYADRGWSPQCQFLAIERNEDGGP